MKYEININDKNEVAINYNGKCYGVWNNEANIDYPEDLTFGRELNEILEIGIDIGRQMERDGEVNKLKQADVMPSLPTDEDIMKWSKEFNESDIELQAQFRVIAKFIRLCMKGNGA